jgi:hypothetical protein
MKGAETNGKHRPVGRFDPVAGMRAMAEIQAEGLRAAGEVLDRIVGAEPAPGLPSAGRDEHSALVDAWAELLRRSVSALTNLDRAVVAVPVDGDGDGPGPVVRAVAGGDPVEVWLQNRTGTAVGPLTLRCGPLCEATGRVLDARVRFEPATVAELPARSSRAVSVVCPKATSPGVYRGVIQAEGVAVAAVWLLLEVTVR